MKSIANNQVRLIGPFSQLNGYSKMTRAVLRTLLVAGYEVQAIESDCAICEIRWWDQRTSILKRNPEPKIQLPDMQDREVKEAFRTLIAPDAPTLMIQLPGNLGAWPHYGHTPIVGWTMTESDNLSEEWRVGCRNVDLLLAPSTYVLETFERCVPQVVSTCVHAPVDDRLWSSDGFAEEISQNHPPFMFMSVFSTSERKQWRQLLTAFTEEFAEESDRVGLILKPTATQEPTMMADWARMAGAWVGVDVEKRTDYMLAALYRACRVYVQPSCEGFGLPYVEAAMCGLPSIALDKGGASDVVSEQTGYVCPSFMAPIPGHMLQVYPRKDHNFAQPTIDDLRLTLRRAYDGEKDGPGKGAEARRQAFDRFAPERIAPILRDSIETAISLKRFARTYSLPPPRPRWATAAGNWGDVMCSIGRMREIMRTEEIEKIGVLFYGKDPKIGDWLNLQPWCREVRSFIEPDRRAMTRQFVRMCMVRPIQGIYEWQRFLDEHNAGIMGPVAYTHLCLAEDQEPVYWKNPVLPEDAREWARNVKSIAGDTFLILQPLSIASNPARNHWPYWRDGIQWLLENTSVPLVMVSENMIDYPAHPKLINLTGQTRTMMDVLALAEISSGAITTSNNLAIFAPLIDLPCVVANTSTCNKATFYHRWQRVETISMIEFTETPGDFMLAVQERFGQYFGNSAKEIRAFEKDRPTEADFYGKERSR